MEEFVILHQILNRMITLHLSSNLTFAHFSSLSTDYEFYLLSVKTGCLE